MNGTIITLLLLAVLGEAGYIITLQEDLTVATKEVVKLRKLTQQQAPGDCVSEVKEAATQTITDLADGLKDLVASEPEPDVGVDLGYR